MESSNPLLNRQNAFSLFDRSESTMNLEGVVNKTGILLLLCIGAAALSWTQHALQGPFLILGLIGGLVSCLVGTFKPTTTPFTAPVYAICEGLALGAISEMLNFRYPGIMANAMMLTIAVLGMMLMLYVTRIVRVTEGFARAVFAATAAVALVYVVDLLLRMFGVHVPYIHESGAIGIGISLVVVGIASANLMMDFAVIESNIRQGAPKYMEWYSSMALLVTLVWLYMELLRLLAKMRSDR